MLWTDAYIVTSADMLTVDSEVTDVAASESIVLDGPSGIITKSIEEDQGFLMASMQRFGGYLNSGLVSANHLAAVFNVGGPGVNRTRITLNQMVHDPYLPNLKNWALYRALVKFYKAAYARTITDRYKSKAMMNQAELTYNYYPNLFNVGLPVIYRPMDAPGAILQRDAGTWSTSNVGYAAQIGAVGGTFQVAITYFDSSVYISPTNKLNCESFTSAPITITVPTGNSIVVNINGLIPPSNNYDPALLAFAITAPYNASNWNVYVGLVGGPMYLQNYTNGFLIPLTTAGNQSWQLPSDPVLVGNPASDNGQYADVNYTFQDLVQRG